MNNIEDSVNNALQKCQNIELSSFYKDHQQFSKMYNFLIQEGITHRRESQLKSIQDKEAVSPFSYNVKRKY